MKIVIAITIGLTLILGLGILLLIQYGSEAVPAKPTLPAPTATTEPVKPDPEPAKDPKTPEALPDVPVSDPKSELKALLPNKTLYLEVRPDGGRRILIATEVCLREGQLEVFLCRKNTKEHEAIVRTEVDAQFIHAGMIAAGMKPGTPVQFVNPKTGEAEYKPASGDKVSVLVNYHKNGKLLTHPAQEWIRDQKTMKPMTHDWVFAGSRFLKNPDKPEAPAFYTANNGEVICISNFVDSMLDLPVEVSRDAVALNYDVFTEKVPPLLSKVWVILEAKKEK